MNHRKLIRNIVNLIIIVLCIILCILYCLSQQYVLGILWGCNATIYLASFFLDNMSGKPEKAEKDTDIDNM